MVGRATPDRAHDPEQQATIIIAVWSIILSMMRFRELRQQRQLLETGYLTKDAGVVILPSDAREYLRTFEQLPQPERNAVLPRVLAAALKRFGATGNVQDASQAVHNTCESEHNRLELAVKGDTTAVTNGLGISFNSTLVALTLSIVLMYILHEIQLSQERLTLDIENYAEEELISRLHGN